MRRTLLNTVLLATTLLLVMGCEVTPRERAFNTGVSALWDDVKEDWVPRVESDPTLSSVEKNLKIGPKDSVVSEMDGLIADHKKAMESNGARP